MGAWMEALTKAGPRTRLLAVGTRAVLDHRALAAASHHRLIEPATRGWAFLQGLAFNTWFFAALVPGCAVLNG